MDLNTNPTQDAVSKSDIEAITYNGDTVFSLIYEATDYGSTVIDTLYDSDDDFQGQEVYLGFSPSENAFYMAIEGSMCNHDFDEDDEYSGESTENVCVVAKITVDETTKQLNITKHDEHACFFYSSLHNSNPPYSILKDQLPDMLDIRLD